MPMQGSPSETVARPWSRTFIAAFIGYLNCFLDRARRSEVDCDKGRGKGTD